MPNSSSKNSSTVERERWKQVEASKQHIIIEQSPPKEALGILTTLQGLGFNDQLLSSEKYVLEKLQTLSDQETEEVKQAFVKYSHPGFIKVFSIQLPFGAKQAY